MLKNLLFILAFYVSSGATSQINFMGKPGLMMTPGTTWEEDYHLGANFAVIPWEYSLFENFTELNTTQFYSVRAGFSSFMEVNLSIAHRPKMADKIGVGDRQIDFRFRLLKEKKYQPALVIGLSVPGSTSPVMHHDYLVLSKGFETRYGFFKANLGYGSPLVVRKLPGKDNFFNSLHLDRKKDLRSGNYLNGFFGGLSYMPISFGGLMLEYDTRTWNMGGFLKIRDRFYAHIFNFEASSSWGISFSAQFPLDIKPKSLRDAKHNN